MRYDSARLAGFSAARGSERRAGFDTGFFLLVLLLNPLIPKLRKSPWLSAALDGINAASLGLMLVVTIRLGLASLIDPFTIVLFVAALVAVMKYKVNAAWVVLAGAVLGWAYTAIF